MRIGIFGNTNNYPLLLALALRRRGHDAVLVVNRTQALHRPEAKFPELRAGYPDWMLDCSSIAEEEFMLATPRIGPVLDFLAQRSDALILNGLGPSLLEFCTRPALALLTGSDLTYYADRSMPELRQRNWAPEHRAAPSGRLWTRRFEDFVERQRAGIRAAALVSAPPAGLVPAMDALLRDVGVDDARRHFVYMANVDLPPARPNRTNPRFRIVNGARLNWKMPLPAGYTSQDHKGTDVLLHGFARFLARGGDGELLLFRKGLHLEETGQLARELGISGRLIWRDEVPLQEFHQELAQADVVCDQLGDAFPGMVAVDAMAMGVPVVANFRPEIMAGCFPEPIAACQARTPDEVAGHLTALAGSVRTRIDAGRRARRFARMQLAPDRHAATILTRLGLEPGAPASAAADATPATHMAEAY